MKKLLISVLFVLGTGMLFAANPREGKTVLDGRNRPNQHEKIYGNKNTSSSEERKVVPRKPNNQTDTRNKSGRTAPNKPGSSYRY